MLAHLRYVTSTLSANMAYAVLLTCTCTIVHFMAPWFTSWHRGSLHGTVVHFMAPFFTSWHRGQLHGTIVHFMAPLLGCVSMHAHTAGASCLTCAAWHARTNMLGRMDNCCTNSEHVKMQTMQTQAASEPSRVRRICLKDLGVVLSKANKVTLNMSVYKQRTSKRNSFGFEPIAFPHHVHCAEQTVQCLQLLTIGGADIMFEVCPQNDKQQKAGLSTHVSNKAGNSNPNKLTLQRRTTLSSPCHCYCCTH